MCTLIYDFLYSRNRLFFLSLGFFARLFLYNTISIRQLLGIFAIVFFVSGLFAALTMQIGAILMYFSLGYFAPLN